MVKQNPSHLSGPGSRKNGVLLFMLLFILFMPLLSRPPAHEIVPTFGESLPSSVDLFWNHPHRQTQRIDATISVLVVNPVKLI